MDELGVDAKKESLPGLEYMKGFDVVEDDPRLDDLAKSVQSVVAAKDASTLQTVYGGRYINPANNTLFLTLTDVSKDIREDIIAQLKPADDLHIVFKKCAYTKAQLVEEKEKIKDLIPELKASGVIMTGIGVTHKGNLFIELLDVTPETVEILLEKLPTSTPKDALMIREGSIPTTTSLTSYQRPVIAGIMFQGRTGLMTLKTGSLGFYGTDSDGDEGMLTAAHCVADGLFDGAHQEVYSIYPSKKIGTTKYRAEGDESDSAWIELDNGISGAYQIYPQNGQYDYIVKYQDDFDDLTTGTTVQFVGYSSGFVTTQIEYLSDKMHPAFGMLDNQIWLDGDCLDGDSGGPVYTKSYWMDNIYAVTAKGIMWGNDEVYDWCYASPIDGIENDLGTTLDLTN